MEDKNAAGLNVVSGLAFELKLTMKTNEPKLMAQPTALAIHASGSEYCHLNGIDNILCFF